MNVEKPKQQEEDRLRDEWTRAVRDLENDVADWAKAEGWNVSASERVISEESIGVYTVPDLTLFSAFEGVLKEHLARNHPRVRVADDVSASWLIDRVSGLQRPRLTIQLKDRAHTVRRYRNYLVHQGGSMPATIQFSEALAHLTKFVHRLPDPPY